MKQHVIFGVKCIVGGFVGMVLAVLLYRLAADLWYLDMARQAGIHQEQLLELQRLQQQAQAQQKAQPMTGK